MTKNPTGDLWRPTAAGARDPWNVATRKAPNEAVEMPEIYGLLEGLQPISALAKIIQNHPTSINILYPGGHRPTSNVERTATGGRKWLEGRFQWENVESHGMPEKWEKGILGHHPSWCSLLWVFIPHLRVTVNKARTKWTTRPYSTVIEYLVGGFMFFP